MAEIVRPPWMTDEMYEEWIVYYTDAGGTGVVNAANIATETFRSSATYVTYFPGILRDDGTIRYAYNPEQTYIANINAFRDVITGLKMDPDIFNEDYIAVIEGDKSPLEFQQNVNTLYERVLSQGAAIRDWYSEFAGIEMTNEGILASLMSESVENAVLTRQITMAEIGGEASMQNYDLTTEFVNLLEQAGMDREEAQQEFGTAASIMPVLQSLAARHGNSDDPFDIYDLLGANVLMDADQSKLIRTYGAQEETLFTGGAQVELARTQAGGLGGLEAV